MGARAWVPLKQPLLSGVLSILFHKTWLMYGLLLERSQHEYLIVLLPLRTFDLGRRVPLISSYGMTPKQILPHHSPRSALTTVVNYMQCKRTHLSSWEPTRSKYASRYPDSLPQLCKIPYPEKQATRPLHPQDLTPYTSVSNKPDNCRERKGAKTCSTSYRSVTARRQYTSRKRDLSDLFHITDRVELELLFAHGVHKVRMRGRSLLQSSGTTAIILSAHTLVLNRRPSTSTTSCYPLTPLY